MYKYYAFKDNVSHVAIVCQDSLLDFLDYGLAIHIPSSGKAAFGWIKTNNRLPDAMCNSLGLFMIQNC